MLTPDELDAAEALKSIARNSSLKASLQQMPAVYSVLWPAARRFVAGETRQDGINTARIVAAQGYGVSLEYIGENTTTEQACQASMEEFFALSKAIEGASLPKGTTISVNFKRAFQEHRWKHDGLSSSFDPNLSQKRASVIYFFPIDGFIGGQEWAATNSAFLNLGH